MLRNPMTDDDLAGGMPSGMVVGRRNSCSAPALLWDDDRHSTA